MKRMALLRSSFAAIPSLCPSSRLRAMVSRLLAGLGFVAIVWSCVCNGARIVKKCNCVQVFCMSDNVSFVQLLDDVRNKFSLMDKEIAEAIDCQPTYLSRLRNGKQNAGPSITKALVNFLETGTRLERKSDDVRGSLTYLAALAQVHEQDLLTRLLSKHGLEVALELKQER